MSPATGTATDSSHSPSPLSMQLPVQPLSIITHYLLSYTVVAKPNTNNIDLTNGLTFAYCAPLRKSTYATQVTSCGVLTAQLTVTCNLGIHSRSYVWFPLHTRSQTHFYMKLCQ